MSCLVHPLSFGREHLREWYGGLGRIGDGLYGCDGIGGPQWLRWMGVCGRHLRRLRVVLIDTFDVWWWAVSRSRLCGAERQL